MFKSMVWTAVVRSLVQRLLEIALASAFGMGIVNFMASIGIEFGETERTTIVQWVSVFLFGLIVAAVNALGPKFSWINKIISLGLSRTAPAYVPNDADAVVSKANVGSSDTVTAIDTPPPGPDNAGPGEPVKPAGI